MVSNKLNQEEESDRTRKRDEDEENQAEFRIQKRRNRNKRTKAGKSYLDQPCGRGKKKELNQTIEERMYKERGEDNEKNPMK